MTLSGGNASSCDSEVGSGPGAMPYCGPAIHTLFISFARMAGDYDFIKSGRVGGWVGWRGGLKS